MISLDLNLIMIYGALPRDLSRQQLLFALDPGANAFPANAWPLRIWGRLTLDFLAS